VLPPQDERAAAVRVVSARYASETRPNMLVRQAAMHGSVTATRAACRRGHIVAGEVV